MRAQVIAIALSTLTLVPAAHADFQIMTQSQLPTNASKTEMPEVPDKLALGHLSARPSVRSLFTVARGFGKRVPLQFAVLQIVPKTVAIRYGLGVNPDDAVDWTGGQGWNRVLARAIAPLHLRLAMTPQGLIIRKSPGPFAASPRKLLGQREGDDAEP